MMKPIAIPIIEARGTHREVGYQIGEQCQPQIESMLSHLREDLPAGVGWDEMLEQSNIYLQDSRAVYPLYVEELEGIAEGAKVPFDEIFLSCARNCGKRQPGRRAALTWLRAVRPHWTVPR
jgi:isopenicillin-N N-acyltransferase like protein